MAVEKLTTVKACFISGSYPPIRCGIGDYTQRLARALTEQGVQVRVITSKEGVSGARDGEVIILPLVRDWTMRALPEILASLRANLPDLVNLQYPTQRYGRQPFVNVLPAFLRARLGIPVITTIHEFSTYRLPGKLRVGLSLLTSQRVIVTDHINLRQIARAFPFFRSKLRHAPIGANIEPMLREFDRQYQRAHYGATDSDVVLAYFGFISPSKGIETLLQAFALAQRERSELRLLLIANREAAEPRYADYHRKIERTLAALHLDDRICWTGYVAPRAVSEYLASADLAILPFDDGASLRRTTLLSALAHGLPAISTGARAPCPGVEVVPIGDAAALAQTIVRLSADRQLRTRLGAEARQFAATLSWDGIARQIVAVFETAGEE